MSISRAKFTAIYSGTTSIAKKVYEATPKQDMWTVAQISSEMKRSGTSVDHRVLSGCLDSLVRSGLVRQPRKGEYRRESIREIESTTHEPETVEQEESAPMPPKQTPQPAAKTPNPLDRLEELSQRLVGLAEQLGQLAGDIADAAIDIQVQMDTKNESAAKLKQLQSLLKDIGATADA